VRGPSRCRSPDRHGCAALEITVAHSFHRDAPAWKSPPGEYKTLITDAEDRYHSRISPFPLHRTYDVHIGVQKRLDIEGGVRA
jgi:hypothetical protein